MNHSDTHTTDMTELPTSLADILTLYQSLPSPTAVPNEGRFFGESIGPGWLIAMGWPMLNFGPLAGWKGKQFYSNGRVLNIVERKGKESEIVPIAASIAPFSKGQGDSLQLAYPKETPFPWNLVTDELRELPDGRYLGVTTFDAPLFKAIPYPFVLTPA